MDGEHTHTVFLPDLIIETGGRLFPKPPKALQSLHFQSTSLAAVQCMAKVLPDTPCVLHTSANLQRLSPEPRVLIWAAPALVRNLMACRGILCRTTLLQTGESCTSPASKTLVGFAFLIATQSLHHLLRQVWLKKPFMSFTQHFHK